MGSSPSLAKKNVHTEESGVTSPVKPNRRSDGSKTATNLNATNKDESLSDDSRSGHNLSDQGKDEGSFVKVEQELISIEVCMEKVEEIKVELEKIKKVDLLTEEGCINNFIEGLFYEISELDQILATHPRSDEKIRCQERLGDIWCETQTVNTLTTYCITLYALEFEQNLNYYEFIIVGPMSVLVNSAFLSEKFSNAVCQASGFLEFIHSKIMVGTDENEEKNERRMTILYYLIMIIHNCCLAKSNINDISKHNFLSVLEPLMAHNLLDFRNLVIMTFANLLNEEESKLFRTNKDAILFLIDVMAEATNSAERRAVLSEKYNMTYFAVGLARTLTRMARNDSTKGLLVEQGVLPVLMDFIRTGDEEECREGAKLLLALAFDDKNQEEMVKDSGVIECLFNLMTRRDTETKKAAERALWLLKEKLVISPDYRKEVEKLFPPQATRHLMISYQTENRQILLKVKSVLESNGFRVWMDVSDMGGEVLSAMAEAVENAAAVLVCYSSKYKESDFCRMEASYAKTKRKKLFFLKMEEAYAPDGWLGFLVGDNYFYDLSGKYDFENKITQLLTWIRKGLIKEEQSLPTHHGNLTHGTPTFTTFSQKDKLKAKLKEVKGWTTEQMAGWLDQNQIPRESLQNLTGVDVAFLSELKSAKAMDTFVKIVTKLLKIKDHMERVHVMARFSQALEDLTDVE